MEPLYVCRGVFEVTSRLSGGGVPSQEFDQELRLPVEGAGIEYLLDLLFFVALDFDGGWGGNDLIGNWGGTGLLEEGDMEH